MALSIAWPIIGEKRADWERMIQFTGYCEVLPDRSKPQQVEKAFKEWAMKHHLAYVEGQNVVAFEPKAFNPKDSLDRQKFGFLARYFRPRETSVFQRDIRTAFNISSMYVLDAVQSYWMAEGVIQDLGGRIQVDRDLLRLMGFTYLDLIQALDGVVKKSYLDAVANGHRLNDPVFGQEIGQYIVNFDILKERFFEGEFVLQAAGQPIPFSELGQQMGVDHMDDLKTILIEAKKRFDLNIEVSEDHVMFGPPSKAAVESIIARERQHKDKLTESETGLKERSKTIRDLLDRYTVKEAKIMNEIESLKDEGRTVYVKSKVVEAVQTKIGENGRK